jgi:hypothetical protein
MCCDHCHGQITPGTEQTFWDSAKHFVWVCATCAAFLISTVSFGQLSPQQQPPPILQATRSVAVDSGSSGSTLSARYWQQLNGCFLDCQDSDHKQVASLTLPHAGSSPALPGEDKPEPEHPPHEGSTFVGISGSGVMSNTAAVATISSWDPPDPAYSSLAHIFEPQWSARGVMLKIGPVAPQHCPFLPRARRNCSRS